MIGFLRAFYERRLRDTAVGTIWRTIRYDIYRAFIGNFIYRTFYVHRHFARRIAPAYGWLLRSRERANFTYDLADRNKVYLAEMLAVALNETPKKISAYLAELDGDEALRAEIGSRVARAGRINADPVARYGRRMGWYAVVRCLKPGLVVETGVDKGLGAMTLCAALLKNRAEGYPGHYIGTDIDPDAGVLFGSEYRAVGEIRYGDSIETLSALDEPIDLFINDSDHSADYEAREYDVIASKLSPTAFVLGDNAHSTDALQRFSRAHGRHFMFFREEPKDHWYPGAGIGISFKQALDNQE